MPTKSKSKAEDVAKMLGTGGANRAAKALIKRKSMIDEAADSDSSSSQSTSSQPKMRDASKGATRDYQMQQAIEMVRKKKSARRTDY